MIDEKRLYNRFDPAIEISGFFELSTEVRGEFRNREEFIIKDISVGGFNLVSSFSPVINAEHSIVIHYRDNSHIFTIRIAFIHIQEFLVESKGILRSGPVFSIGCEIKYDNEQQREMVVDIIKNDCIFPKTIEPPEENSPD